MFLSVYRIDLDQTYFKTWAESIWKGTTCYQPVPLANSTFHYRHSWWLLKSCHWTFSALQCFHLLATIYMYASRTIYIPLRHNLGIFNKILEVMFPVNCQSCFFSSSMFFSSGGWHFYMELWEKKFLLQILQSFWNYIST